MELLNKPADIRQTPARIFRRFLRFGCLAWGGPAAQIAMLRQELVEEEKWVSTERFNRALAVYQVLPGPEAHELCVWFGMIAGGRAGGFMAGLGFMLPGFLLMLALTWFYLRFGIGSPVLQAVFTGFQAAVIALIFSAVHRIGKHVLVNGPLITLALLSALATFCGAGFIPVLAVAGIANAFWMAGRRPAAAVLAIVLAAYCTWSFSPGMLWNLSPATTTINVHLESPSSLWYVFLTGLKGGLLTFGGAYTVIPFIQQDAVINYGWMSNEQFLDGIALSGILPAPLIIFSTFVGFFGSGWPGAFIITLAIFLPAFCFTLIGHRVIESVIENKNLHHFLDGITAGVIGLIAVTAIQLFGLTIDDWSDFIIFIVALIVLFRVKTKFTAAFVIFGAGMISLIQYKII